jgi:hypothetical protein
VGKIGERNNLECHNCSHEKPLWEKIRQQALSYVDIASLKSIVRKLLNQNPHRGKSTM